MSPGWESITEEVTAVTTPSATPDGEAYPGKICRRHVKCGRARQTRDLPSLSLCLSVTCELSTVPGTHTGLLPSAGRTHEPLKERRNVADENAAWLACAFGSPSASEKGPEPSSLSS